MHHTRSPERHIQMLVQKHSKGFSLVEVMVASVVLFASVGIAVTLFNFTNRNAGSTERKQDEQSAISKDLAAVLRLNDQFRCTSGGVCSNSGIYPNEDEYISSSTADIDSFCNANGTGTGFASLLVEEIENLSREPSLESLNITRSANIPPTDSNSNQPQHLYSVQWKRGETVLRQVSLVPTVAAWCP